MIIEIIKGYKFASESPLIPKAWIPYYNHKIDYLTKQLSSKNLDIEEYFQENNGNNKIIFANKYVELMFEEENSEDYIPSWIKEIKSFFNN